MHQIEVYIDLDKSIQIQREIDKLMQMNMYYSSDVQCYAAFPLFLCSLIYCFPERSR